MSEVPTKQPKFDEKQVASASEALISAITAAHSDPMDRLAALKQATRYVAEEVATTQAQLAAADGESRRAKRLALAQAK